MISAIKKPQSICIMRLSAIGDICHAIATVQAIQQRHPQAKITWIIGKTEAQLVANLANIELVIFDKKKGLGAYTDLYKIMRKRRFHILLHMQVALRASIATLFIRAQEKWGFDKKRAREGQWLFTNRRIGAQSEPHVADGFWGFALAVGVSPSLSPVWSLPIQEKDERWCKKLTQGKPYVVISPAASKRERNWLIQNYARMAEYATDKGYSVFISGGPTLLEKNLSKSIIQESQSLIVNLVGETSLTQLLTLIKFAKLVIAPDSGPIHMATIVQTPVIGLYAHSNPNRTGPYHYRNTCVSVYEELLLKQTGLTISQARWGKRLQGDDLMRRITVVEVKSCFDEIINGQV